MNWQIRQAVRILNKGGVLAYPTETVYGLGCNPLDAIAVMHLLSLKNRPVAKGLILLAANFDQLTPYIYQLDTERMREILATWPGPRTWLFPATAATPAWITGQYETVAVRVTEHPLARSLCLAFGHPIVSTSANISGRPPVKTALRTRLAFGDDIDFVLNGIAGPYTRPSEIRDAITGSVVRSM